MQPPDSSVPPPPNDDDLAAWDLQRKRVATHLAWLDARIAGLRSRGDDLKATETPPPPDSATNEQGSPAAAALSPEAKPLFAETPPDFPESPEAEHTLHSARLGCTVLAVLAIGGTVFFFFVLPYWIYR